MSEKTVVIKLHGRIDSDNSETVKQELKELLDQTSTMFSEEDINVWAGKENRKESEHPVSFYVSVLNSGRVRKTDLHMHTTVSDGTDTPEELIAIIRSAGIPLFSVTDHDSVKGCSIIRDCLKEGDPHFISGVEFSCKDETGEYHILGYGIDPDAPSIQKMIEIGHSYRIRKARARLDYLKKEFNIALPDEAVKRLYEMDNPGKPHIGNLLVKYGFAPTKDQAIRRFLNQIHFYNEYLRPEEAVVGILAAGGIPVLAHPFHGSGNDHIEGEALEQRLKTLMNYGLKGAEAFYSGFSGKQSSDLAVLAERNGLYVTAGSDYHGKNKKIFPGETGMDLVTDLPDGFRRFLKDVRYLH